MRGEFKASATRRTQPVNCNHDQPHAIKRAAETVSHSASNCRSPLPRTLSDAYRRPSASERSPTNGIPLFRLCELPVTNCQLPITDPPHWQPLSLVPLFPSVRYQRRKRVRTPTNSERACTLLHAVAREKNNPPELHPQFHFTHHASLPSNWEPENPKQSKAVQSSPKLSHMLFSISFPSLPNKKNGANRATILNLHSV